MSPSFLLTRVLSIQQALHLHRIPIILTQKTSLSSRSKVVGGVRLHRDAGVPTRMDIIPHLPEGTQQGPVSMKFTNPGSAHEWEVTHDYKKDQESYRFNLDGNFDAVPELVLETPPLPRGKRPVKGENCPPYSIKEKPGKDGLVRYEVHFEGLSGQQRVDLSFV